MQSYKIKISSKEESKIVQEHAFSIGYRWYMCTTIKRSNAPHLHFDKNGIITFSKEKEMWDEWAEIEVTIEEFLTLTEVGGEIKMDTIKSMEKSISNMECELNEMKASLKKLNEKKDTGWGIGTLTYGINSKNQTYTPCIKLGTKELEDACNAFTSKEKAEEIAFKQKLHRQLQRFADESNINYTEWDYYIYYDYDSKIIKIAEYQETLDFGGVYFSSSEIAEKAINKFKTDLTKYFTL